MDRSFVTNYREEFAQRAPQLAGADLLWLSHARRDALDQFDTLGFPTPRLEDWKYTNAADVAKHAFKFADTPTNERGEQGWKTRLSLDADGDDFLVFINGMYSPLLSRRRHLPDGIVATNMAHALVAHAKEIEDIFERNAGRAAHGFAALNMAWWSDGAYIALPDGATLDHAVHLVFVCADAELECHVRNLIRVGAGARVRVIEHYLGENDARYFTNAITQIEAASGAAVEHYKVQEEGTRAFHVASIDVQQGQGSRLSSHSFAFGALLSRTDIATRFLGEGCDASLNGLYVANGRQHVDHHTRIDHIKPHGTSREYYKGILDGAARGVFNGKVIVHEGAQKSDAFQSNRNLLLSANAEIDTKPQLEIYADDVKCSHGATVGQLDENQIFYLRSRGMDDVAARNLLTYAFADEIVAQVPVASLRSRLEESLRQKLQLQQTVDLHAEER